MTVQTAVRELNRFEQFLGYPKIVFVGGKIDHDPDQHTPIRCP
jgi:hypothetical protein